MKNFYPGTVIEKSEKSAGEFLFAIFSATKGLTLAQVREITGLDTPAIQNWVNRGWVARPVDKRYSVNHLARILIINMLRDCMKFEAIANVLSYVNGDVEDLGDDIINEGQLYLYICDAIDRYHGDTREIDAVVKEAARDYSSPVKDARDRLETALGIFLSYYEAALAVKTANERYNGVFNFS